MDFTAERGEGIIPCVHSQLLDSCVRADGELRRLNARLAAMGERLD